MLVKYYINQPENDGGTVYLYPNYFSKCMSALALYSKVCRKHFFISAREIAGGKKDIV